jgi:hypothetical protein
MSKYQVNWAGKATGPFGEFGNLLVTPIGFTAGADKITIRTTPQVADKVAKAIAGLKGTNLVLTVNAETSEVVFADGTQGVRQENWTNKAGEAVSQTALYLRFASTPIWAKEVGKDDEGNLGDL